MCLLRPFVADAAGLDSLVRIAAMTLWAGAATWLATGLIARRELQAVLLLVLFTSQYPFLWLSTELVAGGLLCLVLGAWVRGAPPWVTGSLLALSLAKGARKAGWAFQWAWLAVPLLIVLRRRCGLALDANERALLATAIGVVPFVLFAYPHIRYFARYYPLFWILLLLSVEKLAILGESRRPTRGLIAVGLVTLLALAENVERASLGLALVDRLDPYWFPD